MKKNLNESNSAAKNISIAIIISFIIIFIIAVCIFNSSSVSQRVKENIKNATIAAGLDSKKLETIGKSGDWPNGTIYKAWYNVMDELYFYTYENEEVACIKKGSLTGEVIYKNENAVVTEKEENAIYLINGQLGEYGKEDIFDNEKYIRYYVPVGKYKVRPSSKFAVFFVESIEYHKNTDGYDEPNSMKRYELKENEETIEIKEGECISLALSSSIELKKE